jgi:hypothetical protein
MNQSGMKYTRGWEKVRREPCAYFSLRVRFFSAKVAVACKRSFLTLATQPSNGLITLPLKLKFIFQPEIGHIDRYDTKVTNYTDSDATSKT